MVASLNKESDLSSKGFKKEPSVGENKSQSVYKITKTKEPNNPISTSLDIIIRLVQIWTIL